MDEEGPNLVTNYVFKGGKEYVVKMRVANIRGLRRRLEVVVTDKNTAEAFVGSYDTGYIENLTQKTGNYKQFDVFVAMLQSGLLKTSECISLDLLTFEDLEFLRSRKTEETSSSTLNNSCNRRYFILTYTAEFDRIHYPLPLEYAGPPDPTILQATIRRLESEIEKLKSSCMNKELQKRLEQLTLTNRSLSQENQKLANGSGKGTKRLLAAMKTLENNMTEERASFRVQVQKLRAENAALSAKVRKLSVPSRKQGDGNSCYRRRNPTPPRSSQSWSNVDKWSRSRSPSLGRRLKTPELSRGNSMESLKLGSRRVKSHHAGLKELDFGNLESRIQTLQKMLREGINLS